MFVIFYEYSDYDESYFENICVIDTDDEEKAKHIIGMLGDQAKDAKLHAWLRRKFYEMGMTVRVKDVDQTFYAGKISVYELKDTLNSMTDEFFQSIEKEYDLIDIEAFRQMMLGCDGFWRDMKNGEYKYHKIRKI